MYELLLKTTSELLIAYPVLSSKRPKFKLAKRQMPKQGERQHARRRARAPLLKGLVPRLPGTASCSEPAACRASGAQRGHSVLPPRPRPRRAGPGPAAVPRRCRPFPWRRPRLGRRAARDERGRPAPPRPCFSAPGGCKLPPRSLCRRVRTISARFLPGPLRPRGPRPAPPGTRHPPQPGRTAWRGGEPAASSRPARGERGEAAGPALPLPHTARSSAGLYPNSGTALQLSAVAGTRLCVRSCAHTRRRGCWGFGVGGAKASLTPLTLSYSVCQCLSTAF